MVNTSGNLDCIVWSSIKRVCEGGTVEVRILLVSDIAVPLRHGLLESSSVYAHRLCECLVILTGNGVALLDVALDNGRSVYHLLVYNEP